ncbi:MAG: PadR family transcriptional regulator [Mobilicoccus sp.]|nr:PadR family transcriptional regulator [Mobilicoccus sp.]
MSVKHGLLALLLDGPSYGAALRWAFEERTAGSWPLNVGQVYTTLGRLERDGLVQADSGPDEEGRIRYRITDAGRADVVTWWSSAVPRDVTPRDELAIKLALAVTMPDVDVAALVHVQRTATLAQIRALTRQKADLTSALATGTQPSRSADERTILARLLVVENLIHAAEAEATWLDHVENRLR